MDLSLLPFAERMRLMSHVRFGVLKRKEFTLLPSGLQTQYARTFGEPKTASEQRRKVKEKAKRVTRNRIARASRRINRQAA